MTHMLILMMGVTIVTRMTMTHIKILCTSYVQKTAQPIYVPTHQLQINDRRA